MEDDKPFLFTDHVVEPKKKSAVTASLNRVRSKFWKRSTMTLSILIAVLLAPMILVLILAATIDPLYGWLLIPAIIPAMLAVVLIIVGTILAAVFLATQKPSKNEQVAAVIVVTFGIVVFIGAVMVYPAL